MLIIIVTNCGSYLSLRMMSARLMMAIKPKHVGLNKCKIHNSRTVHLFVM
jgi:hypothetical protein